MSCPNCCRPYKVENTEIREMSSVITHSHQAKIRAFIKMRTRSLAAREHTEVEVATLLTTLAEYSAARALATLSAQCGFVSK